MKTPIDLSVKLHQDSSMPFEDILSYIRLVGKLLYLTITRPVIIFVTQHMIQFLSSPTTIHYDTTSKVLKYLKGLHGIYLLFRRESSIQLLGFTNAYWAGCMDTRRSTSGYFLFNRWPLISWRAKKQQTISRSSYEVEIEYCHFLVVNWNGFFILCKTWEWSETSLMYYIVTTRGKYILLLVLSSMNVQNT